MESIATSALLFIFAFLGLPLLLFVSLGVGYLLLRLLGWLRNLWNRFWEWLVDWPLGPLDILPTAYEQPNRPLLYGPRIGPRVSRVTCVRPTAFEPKIKAPRICKDFGPHHNPLLLDATECLKAFEQVDERTWQCPECGLMHFEKPQGALMVRNLTQVAQLADALKRPENVQEGYVAERHPLVPSLVVVWAPCGCYCVGSGGLEGFITTCNSEACDFKYEEAERALQALQQAESWAKMQANSQANPAGGPAILTKEPNGPNPTASHSSTADAGFGSGEDGEEAVASEESGGSIKFESPSPEASDMINEGGPIPMDFDLGGEA